MSHPTLSMSRESSQSLLARGRAGDAQALDVLFARYLPVFNRWAAGRLPAWARDLSDTRDLVQDALMRTLRQLDRFEVARPRRARGVRARGDPQSRPRGDAPRGTAAAARGDRHGGPRPTAAGCRPVAARRGARPRGRGALRARAGAVGTGGAGSDRRAPGGRLRLHGAGGHARQADVRRGPPRRAPRGVEARRVDEALRERQDAARSPSAPIRSPIRHGRSTSRSTRLRMPS